MITLWLTILAAICCATYQVLDRYFFNSRFKKFNQNFWYPHQSWRVAPKIFGYRIDAWHLLQSTMIISMICGSVFYQSITGHWYYDIGIYGLAWNISFSLFLNVVWRKK